MGRAKAKRLGTNAKSIHTFKSHLPIYKGLQAQNPSTLLEHINRSAVYQLQIKKERFSRRGGEFNGNYGCFLIL